MTAVQPPPSFSTMKKRLDVTVKDAHSVGLTSVHDAYLNPLPLEFFKRYVSHTLLPLLLLLISWKRSRCGNTSGDSISSGIHAPLPGPDMHHCRFGCMA